MTATQPIIVNARTRSHQCQFFQDKRGLREFYFLHQVGKNSAPEQWRQQFRQLRADAQKGVVDVDTKGALVDKINSLQLPDGDAEKADGKASLPFDQSEYKRTDARAASTIRRLVARLVSLGIGRWGQR